VGAAIFLILWSGYHGDMTIMKNNSKFSLSLALSDEK
jgi:hypothetical protein